MLGKHYFKEKDFLPSVLIRTYIEFFKDCKLVLDVGCGNNLLKKHLSNVIGIDFSKHSKADVLGDATKLPFKSETFDGLLAKDIIEHLLYPDYAIVEFRRVLKKGGKIIVETSTPTYKHFWDDYTHIRPFTKKSLNSLLLNSNLSILKIEYFSSCDLPGFPQIGLRDLGVTIRNALTRGGILRATNLRAVAVKQ